MTEQSSIHRRRQGRHFAERMAHDLAQSMERAFDADALGARQGVLQQLDPRAKLVSTLALIVSGVLTHSLLVLCGLFALALALALVSRIPLARLYGQVWVGVLLFTGAIALPAIVVVPGDPLWRVPLLGVTATFQGVRSAGFLIGRGETSATLALLLIVSTPWTHVLKAMRSLGVPVVLVAILGMTHRYIFLLVQNAAQLFEARRSRILSPMSGAQQRQLATAAAGALLGKTFELSSEVHLAMISRGYRGEVHLLDEFHARPRDWFALLFALSVPAMILWFQR